MTEVCQVVDNKNKWPYASKCKFYAVRRINPSFDFGRYSREIKSFEFICNYHAKVLIDVFGKDAVTTIEPNPIGDSESGLGSEQSVLDAESGT